MHLSDFFKNDIDQYISSKMTIQHPTTLYEPMRYAVAEGGKRLRGNFVMMGNLLTQKPLENIYDLALAIEILHAFSLVHDDIIDNSDMRRGKPTVVNKYGLSSAILTGDALLVKAYEYLANANPTYLAETLATFNRVVLEMCEGQEMDIQLEREQQVSKSRYLEMIGKKTGVLLATALSIAAVASNGDVEISRLLYEIGYKVGLTFQVQDDWLDAFGTEQVGKSLGTDIINAKSNYLYVVACENLKGNALQDFISLYMNTNLSSSKKIEDVQKVYEQLGVSQFVQNEIQMYIGESFDLLNNFPSGNSEVKNNFKIMVNALIGRQS